MFHSLYTAKKGCGGGRCYEVSFSFSLLLFSPLPFLPSLYIFLIFFFFFFFFFRVADERAERIGERVGYAIRMETKRSAKTKILFCTTGVVLRWLQNDPYLTKFSHIIVDEVHERAVDSDFLLLLLRFLFFFKTTQIHFDISACTLLTSLSRQVCKSRPDLRIILMSATVSATQFVNYFSPPSSASNTPLKKPATFEIPGRTCPVSEYFVEDVFRMSNYFLQNKGLKRDERKKKYNNNHFLFPA